MAASRAPALYTPEVLGLAVELAAYPHDPLAPAQGSARSRSCGSVIALSSGETDRIDRLGLSVSACAIGQASAAIFARTGQGMDVAALSAVLAQLEAWLEGAGDAAFLPRLEMIAAARDYPARHGAILLPWRAALDALSNDGTTG